MKPSRLSTAHGPHHSRVLGTTLLVIGLAGCGGLNAEEPTVTVTANHANVVSYWNDIANKTVNAGVATAADASIYAAASAAAYGVLRALFPNLGVQYQVAHADTIGACFEAKYFFDFWRPQSAIALADDDGNPATTSDAAWTPVAQTPNHPEYPAAHSRTFDALGETLRQYYGTRQVTCTLDSAAAGTTRTYATTDALNDESHLARVHGGMHFAFSTVVGVELGRRVAQWVATHHFGRRK